MADKIGQRTLQRTCSNLRRHARPESFDLAGDAAERFAAVEDEGRKLEAIQFAHLNRPEDEAMLSVYLRGGASRGVGHAASALEQSLAVESMRHGANPTSGEYFGSSTWSPRKPEMFWVVMQDL